MRTLEEIRNTLNEMGNHSHTTQKFQDDVLRHARESAVHGNCLIEVGCYRGGLTAQFAWLAKKLGQQLHVIDIDAGYLQVAKEAIQATVDDVNVSFHLSDLDSFVRGEGREINPSFVLIDGDHYYNGVISDIKALLAMPFRPHSVAFHDFSLRYADPALSEIRVDKALKDMLGPDFPHLHIGEVSRAGGALRTEPGTDNSHYHELGYPEGVLIELRNLKLNWISLAT